MPRVPTNKDFFFYERNEDPVILEPPKNYKPMTPERYQELINGQKSWREQFIKHRAENTYSKIYYKTNIKKENKSSSSLPNTI
jgi:hypothetical protein